MKRIWQLLRDLITILEQSIDDCRPNPEHSVDELDEPSCWANKHDKKISQSCSIHFELISKVKMDMEMDLSQEEANHREADAVEAECCLLAAASFVIIQFRKIQKMRRKLAKPGN